MPNTKQRQIRCPDNIWMPAAERARREGTTISRVINDLLLDYGRPVTKTEGGKSDERNE